MAIRDDLYTRFENFDKPDEQDFRLFIDTALSPTIFEELILSKISDIVTDINTVSIVLDIREVKVVKHGVDVYLFSATEGSYGQGGIAILADMLTYIGALGSQGLSQDLIADINLGGVRAGNIFLSGTSYEQMWRALLTTTTVKNLRYEANTLNTSVEIGTTVDISKFLWSVTGNPTNMNLTDNLGLNLPVSGTEVVHSKSYMFTDPAAVTFVLSSTESTTTRTVRWLAPTYSGKNTTGYAPTTQSAVLAGNKQLSVTNAGVTVSLNTSDTEYGWIAVPAETPPAPFTKWFVSELNKAAIGPNEFIRLSNSVTVDGREYDIYIFNYSSSLATLKLY